MRIRKLLAVLILVAVAITAEAVPLHKYQVRNAAQRQAVCNDGTPAVYYFRPGSGSGINNWVIFLGGGAFCFSVQSCDLRWRQSPELMTSRGKPATLQLDGLLSDSPAANPDFYNANHVVVPYCTSDLWSGDREGSQATREWEFRGIRVFRALVQDLKTVSFGSGPTLSAAQQVLLSGTSAGGAGVMVNLDWLAAQLPGANVRGLNDGGWIPQFLPDWPGVPSVQGLVRNAAKLWHGKPDVTCANANSDSIDHCYDSSVYPYLQTPLMVQESQHDTWVLGILQVHYPYNSWEQLIVNYFAAAVRRSLVPVHAAFSPRTNTHGLAPYTRFNSVKISGWSLRRVLGNWFFDRPGPKKVIRR